MCSMAQRLFTRSVYRYQLTIKKRAQLEEYEKFVKRDMKDLLVTPSIVYHVLFSDDDLLAYLKGAVYRFKHLQVLRALAVCAADSDERFEKDYCGG